MTHDHVVGHEHVVDDLAAYVEDQLAPDRRAIVAAHLGACPACRDEHDRVQRGVQLLGELAMDVMPDAEARVLRGALVGAVATPSPRARRPWVGLARAAAVMVLVGGSAAAYWEANRPWIRLESATAPATAFEDAGRELHDRLQNGQAQLDRLSSDARTLWAWLESEAAPVTRPIRIGADPSRFVPVGAAVRQLAGARVSVLEYRVDGHPVTLALANRDEVANRPPAGLWSKRVLHRRLANGRHSLTWTIGQGTYVMISELDGAGQRACLVCHDTPRFIQRVSALEPVAR